MANKSIFQILNAIDCNAHVEKKNELTYLSWAWAWQMVKNNFPDATYSVSKNEEPTPIYESVLDKVKKQTRYGEKEIEVISWTDKVKFTLPSGTAYKTDGRTCWVETSVKIGDLEHTEYLPIMDNANRAIPADRLDMMDVNKAIQRGLTKAAARHGLGLYIYAGEDLPEAKIESDIQAAIDEVNSAESVEALADIYNKHLQLMNTSKVAKTDITAALTARKVELTKAS